MEQKINFLEQQYKKILEIDKLQKEIEEETTKYFNLKEEEEVWKRGYLNPVKYDNLNDQLKKIRDNFIRAIIFIFNEEFPNVPINNEDFEDCINTFINKFENECKGIIIDFKQIRNKLTFFEVKADELSLEKITKHSLRLIPHHLLWESYGKRIKLKKEKLLKKNKLILECRYSFGSPNRKNIEYFKKLVNVILKKEKPSKVKSDPTKLFFKYYKNGRVDVEFEKSDDAEKVADYLVGEGNKDA